MAKILNINDMLGAAQDSALPSFELHRKALEAAAALLAEALASHLGVITQPGGYEQHFGGLCCNFYAKRKGQKCPDAIHEGDEGGEWHTVNGVECPCPPNTYRND
jgi:hypothetical protein